MTTEVNQKGTKGMLLWFKLNQPALYNQISHKLIAASRSPGKMAGIGADFSVSYDKSDLVPFTDLSAMSSGDAVARSSEAPTSSAFADTLQSLVQAASAVYLTKQQLDTQNKIVNAQLQRAQANLPPLNIDPQALGLPSVGVSVGLSSGTGKWLLYGGLALGAFLVLPKLFEGRRA